MSEEQLAALLAKLKDDAGLQEKLKGAADLDAVLAIAKDAGFDVSKAAWLRYQANQMLEVELSDEELEGVSGGVWTKKEYYLTMRNWRDLTGAILNWGKAMGNRGGS
jgi:predicted ribosomally synthesized peptide with nif11-like leader